MQHQTEDDFTLCWKQLQLIKPIGIQTIVTDGDRAMITSLKKVFSEAKLLRCYIHLKRNIAAHMSGNGNAGDSIIENFKTACYAKDLQTFQTAKDKMLLLASSFNDDNRSLNYLLESIFSVEDQWARSKYQPLLTFNITTTQIVESENSSLKRQLIFDRSSTFFHLVQDLHRKCEREHYARRKEYDVQMNYRKSIDSTRLHGMTLARYNLTEFALTHLQPEYDDFAGREIQPVLPAYPHVIQALVYRTKSPEQAHCVSITEPNTIHCSCNFPQTMDLPCRHVLFTNMCRDDRRLPLDLSQVNSRWFLDKSPPSIISPEIKDSQCTTVWVPMRSVTWNSQ